MRGQEYHTEGTEWPWRIFTLVFNNRLFGDIVGTQFLKICSALRVAQTGKKKKKVRKESQNSRSTRQLHDTGVKCGLILGPIMQIIPKEKKKAVCHCTGPCFYLNNNTVPFSHLCSNKTNLKWNNYKKQPTGWLKATMYVRIYISKAYHKSRD